MANFPRNIPIDANQSPMQNYPAPYSATARGMRETCVASSVLVLNQNSGTVEVTAIGGSGVAIRWVPLTETPSVSPFSSVIASGLGANFDHTVPAATVRRFVIPRETSGQISGGQTGSVNGLYQRLAIINLGTTAGSVLTSEV